MVEENEELAGLSQKAQDDFTKKETDLREQLTVLEQRLQLISTGNDPEADKRMSKIRGMHTTIQSTIGQMQDKTSKILQNQERDLIRAFRARLHDVTEELKKERSKNENGSVHWVARCHKLKEELEWLRDLSDQVCVWARGSF